MLKATDEELASVSRLRSHPDWPAFLKMLDRFSAVASKDCVNASTDIVQIYQGQARGYDALAAILANAPEELKQRQLKK